MYKRTRQLSTALGVACLQTSPLPQKKFFSEGGGTSAHRLRWELLRPFARSKKFDRFQTLSNNSQQHVSACKRVCKRTQHVTSNDVGGCWLANNVTSVCTGLIDSYRRAHLFILPESLQTVNLLHIKLQLKLERSNNTFVHLPLKDWKLNPCKQ